MGKVGKHCKGHDKSGKGYKSGKSCKSGKRGYNMEERYYQKTQALEQENKRNADLERQLAEGIRAQEVAAQVAAAAEAARANAEAEAAKLKEALASAKTAEKAPAAPSSGSGRG